MTDRRRQGRIERRYSLYFGVTEPKYLGIVRNFSKSGLRISTTTAYRPFTPLVMELKAKPNPVPMQGEIRWTTEAKRYFSTDPKRYEMGVAIDPASPEYKRFFEGLISDSPDNRRDERFNKVFQITYAEPDELMSEYTQNISRGGMFIVTKQAPSMHSTVLVKISILDLATTMSVEGEVVHVVDVHTAERFGIHPGVGIQFKRFTDPEAKKSFDEYISMLQQRASL